MLAPCNGIARTKFLKQRVLLDLREGTPVGVGWSRGAGIEER